MTSKERPAKKGRSLPLWVSLPLFILIVLILPAIALILFFTAPSLDLENSEVDIRAAVATQIYQIFFLLVVLGGSIGAIAYWLMKKDLYGEAHLAVHHALGETIEDAYKRIDDRIYVGSLLSECKAYQGLSEAFFLHYYDDFRLFLKNQDESARMRALRDVQLAKQLIQLGFKLFEEQVLKDALDSDMYHPKYQRKDTNKPFYRHTALLSHYCFHCAAEQVMRNKGFVKVSGKDKYFNDAVQHAKECLKRSHDFRNHDVWYEIQENSAFCLALSRNCEDRRQAKSILTNLIKAQGSPTGASLPSDDWRRDTWDIYNDPLTLNLARP